MNLRLQQSALVPELLTSAHKTLGRALSVWMLRRSRLQGESAPPYRARAKGDEIFAAHKGRYSSCCQYVLARQGLCMQCRHERDLK